ncbi:MAG: hypothetical protein KDB90_06805 [Planctomycetes bacterium]|nr:hypothetical protein [Planctomycetota bacterium]
MVSEISRARDLARELEGGYTVLDKQLSEELASLLDHLVTRLEAQSAKLKAAEFALEYYREPYLYARQTCCTGDGVLDGGLRARTALAAIHAPIERTLPRRVPLPDID